MERTFAKTHAKISALWLLTEGTETL